MLGTGEQVGVGMPVSAAIYGRLELTRAAPSFNCSISAVQTA
jgi:hypothetical protein